MNVCLDYLIKNQLLTTFNLCVFIKQAIDKKHVEIKNFLMQAAEKILNLDQSVHDLDQNDLGELLKMACGENGNERLALDILGRDAEEVQPSSPALSDDSGVVILVYCYNKINPCIYSHILGMMDKVY